MQLEHVGVGQRVRVHVPGVGDDGQIGTIKQVRSGRCYVHLDWDERHWHVVMFYPADLDLDPDAVAAGSPAVLPALLEQATLTQTARS